MPSIAGTGGISPLGCAQGSAHEPAVQGCAVWRARLAREAQGIQIETCHVSIWTSLRERFFGYFLVATRKYLASAA